MILNNKHPPLANETAIVQSEGCGGKAESVVSRKGSDSVTGIIYTGSDNVSGVVVAGVSGDADKSAGGDNDVSRELDKSTGSDNDVSGDDGDYVAGVNAEGTGVNNGGPKVGGDIDLDTIDNEVRHDEPLPEIGTMDEDGNGINWIGDIGITDKGIVMPKV